MAGISSTYNTWILWLIIFLYLLFSYVLLSYRLWKRIVKKTTEWKEIYQGTEFNHWIVLIDEKIVVCEPWWKFLYIVFSWFVFTIETVNIFCYSVFQLCHIVLLPFNIQCCLLKKNTNSFWLGWINIQACEQTLYLLIKSS